MLRKFAKGTTAFLMGGVLGGGYNFVKSSIAERFASDNIQPADPQALMTDFLNTIAKNFPECVIEPAAGSDICPNSSSLPSVMTGVNAILDSYKNYGADLIDYFTNVTFLGYDAVAFAIMASAIYLAYECGARAACKDQRAVVEEIVAEAIAMPDGDIQDDIEDDEVEEGRQHGANPPQAEQVDEQENGQEGVQCDGYQPLPGADVAPVVVVEEDEAPKSPRPR